MNKQDVSVIPDEKGIEELLTKIRPVPSRGLRNKVEKARWWNQKVPNNLHLRPAIVMIVLFLIAIVAITPQGHAWAQEIMQFFQKVNSPVIQLSDEQVRSMNEAIDRMDKPYDVPLMPVIIPPVPPEMLSLSGCETPQKSMSYRCQVALAESKLGFNLKKLPEIPNGWGFKSIVIDTNSQYVVMRFDLDFTYLTQESTSFASYSSLQLIQGIGNFADLDWYKNNPWEVVPQNKVESISIGMFKGEYVKGKFVGNAGSDVLNWNEREEQRLIWSEGNRWYLIEFSPNWNFSRTMDKNELIHLAESLTDSSKETIEPLNPDYLLSISDAEKVSGLDLKAPTLIPMDMDFSYARFLSDKEQVQLVYGINQDLVIYEWEGDPLDYKKPLGKYEYTCEIVNMNGEDALYCFFESTNVRSFLWWHRNGINYQMYYNDSLISGGRIGMEKMLLIAESMQDIDDFWKKSVRNYEQVVLYEQALGIDIKKFLETPTSWRYINFWSDAQSKCIDLIYTYTTGNSTLYISQCGTEGRSNIFSSFPPTTTKRVKVGNEKGQFIAGGFDIIEDGKQVWDPTLAVKQLFWQEDGLWIQIALYGDQALILDKDDLIAIAESMK